MLLRNIRAATPSRPHKGEARSPATQANRPMADGRSIAARAIPSHAGEGFVVRNVDSGPLLFGVNIVMVYREHTQWDGASTVMTYSIREAAEAAGVSKSTIQRRLKEGDISRNAEGKIDPSELARVYPSSASVSHDHGQGAVIGTRRDTKKTGNEHTEISILKAELEAAKKLAEERDRELVHRDETIRDLRDRLDKEGEERRQLTAMLTDQRQKPRGLWARLTGS